MSRIKRTVRKYSLESLERRNLLSGTPQLVGDFNNEFQEGRPTDNAWLNDELFFAADDGVHGREMWVVDPGAHAGAGAPPATRRARLTALRVP